MLCMTLKVISMAKCFQPELLMSLMVEIFWKYSKAVWKDTFKSPCRNLLWESISETFLILFRGFWFICREPCCLTIVKHMAKNLMFDSDSSGSHVGYGTEVRFKLKLNLSLTPVTNLAFILGTIRWGRVSPKAVESLLSQSSVNRLSVEKWNTQ